MSTTPRAHSRERALLPTWWLQSIRVAAGAVDIVSAPPCIPDGRETPDISLPSTRPAAGAAPTAMLDDLLGACVERVHSPESTP